MVIFIAFVLIGLIMVVSLPFAIIIKAKERRRAREHEARERETLELMRRNKAD